MYPPNSLPPSQILRPDGCSFTLGYCELVVPYQPVICKTANLLSGGGDVVFFFFAAIVQRDCGHFIPATVVRSRLEDVPLRVPLPSEAGKMILN